MVNDDSSDYTAQYLEEITANMTEIPVLRKNQRKG